MEMELLGTLPSGLRPVPGASVGACAGLISVNAGSLTITEVEQTGYELTDVYTIPANRLISKNLSGGSAIVSIVEGTASSQTIVVFRNRSVTSMRTPTIYRYRYIYSNPHFYRHDYGHVYSDTHSHWYYYSPHSTFTPTATSTPTRADYGHIDVTSTSTATGLPLLQAQ